MKSQTEVSFDISSRDATTIRKIARRARLIYLDNGTDRETLDISMDLIATHANGCPLRLDDMLAADDFNLMHDISGISRHLDRETGALMDHFRPRYSAPLSAAA